MPSSGGELLRITSGLLRTTSVLPRLIIDYSDYLELLGLPRITLNYNWITRITSIFESRWITWIIPDSLGLEMDYLKLQVDYLGLYCINSGFSCIPSTCPQIRSGLSHYCGLL